MATQVIGDAPPPEPIANDERKKLCEEWAKLDVERLVLGAKALVKKKRQDAIEELLEGQLTVDGVKIVDLDRYQFGVELVKGSFSYKDALVEKIGEKKLQKLVDAVPKKDKFFLRDKGEPANEKPPARVSKRRAA